MSFTVNYCFDRLHIKDDKSRSLTGFSRDEILYLNVTHYESAKEIQSLKKDEILSVADNCIVFVEFSCVTQHQNNPFKTNKVYSFQCLSEDNPKIYSEFACILLNLEKSVRVDDKHNKYFFSGIKVGKAISDQLSLFGTSLNYKILIVDYVKRESKIICISGKDELSELLQSSNFNNQTLYDLSGDLETGVMKPIFFNNHAF